MKRAAVVIGVDKTGRLPRLRDAAKSAERVAVWARAQKMDAVEVLTDAAGPVEASHVKKKIKAIVDSSAYSQLLVFFAGHAVNRQRQEYWLLSGAPDDTQEAVNLAGSAALASTCGIPHVVFISDACRTAAEGIRAQSVTGSEIFPNLEGSTGFIDQFFACELGRPSHEVKDPNVTAAEFCALYTTELLPALAGERDAIVTWDAGASGIGRVHPRPLRDFMSQAVMERLKALDLQTKVIQVPTATIASDPGAWLSEVKRRRGLGFGPGGGRQLDRAPAAPLPAPPSLGDHLAAVRHGVVSPVGDRASAVVDLGIELARPFGPAHHETECGFKVRGARVVGTFSRDSVRVDLIPPGEDLRVQTDAHDSVLLQLDSGSAVLLPAIRGFITALTVNDGELVDVAYEPSDNSWRWPDYAARAGEIRSLRAIAAASLTSGAFHLEGDDALGVARRMQYAKGVDPSLAVYAAYAYHDQQRRDLLEEMSAYLAQDLGAPLFDVALLARKLDGRKVTATRVISPFPLLSQGWALLNAYRVQMPAELDGLSDHLVPSLWTMLDAAGARQVQAALAAGAFR